MLVGIYNSLAGCSLGPRGCDYEPNVFELGKVDNSQDVLLDQEVVTLYVKLYLV